MAIRRINLFAGPGCGKSTLATKIFVRLKEKHRHVELVSEYIKNWAHQGRKPQSYDQLYILAKQLKAEDDLLRSDVRAIVTDSPILMNPAYSSFYNFRPAIHLVKLAQEFDKDFPSLNFFIKRTVKYQRKGRYQTLGQAKVFDDHLRYFLATHLELPLFFCTVDEFDKVMHLIDAVVFGSEKAGQKAIKNWGEAWTPAVSA